MNAIWIFFFRHPPNQHFTELVQMWSISFTCQRTRKLWLQDSKHKNGCYPCSSSRTCSRSLCGPLRQMSSSHCLFLPSNTVPFSQHLFFLFLPDAVSLSVIFSHVTLPIFGWRKLWHSDVNFTETSGANVVLQFLLCTVLTCGSFEMIGK